jgi:thaumarchaeosortase
MWQFVGGGGDWVIWLGRLVGAPYPELDWPIAFESTLYAACFIFSTLLLLSLKGLRRFKVSLFFISAVAVFFMADTFYHQGTIWFLQIFVPPIASASAFFLNILGYPTTASAYADGYLLNIQKAGGHQMSLLVYWPCAGVHSMAIYAIVILLAFKDTMIPSKRKVAYLLVGALGTFLANIARIVSIGIIGANTGPEASRLFHEYYGELFFVAWTVIYLIVVFLCESHHKKRFANIKMRAHYHPCK